MMNSLSDYTISQYNCSLRLWWEFCQLRDISPFKYDVPNIISFLQQVMNTSNNTYSSFNSHRAALSPITSSDLGTNTEVKRFMKGIFRTRPPRPRYNFTWNPQDVLKFLNKPPDKDLRSVSCKLVVLLVLATGQRIQTVALIRCPNIKFSTSGADIQIPDFVKTSGPKTLQPKLSLPYFHECPNLCVASCLHQYLELTKPLRPADCDKLFLTFNKPHGPATKQTLSRWVKNTMAKAGIDTNMFKPHSSRHASTSCALRQGVHIDAICRSAGWSQDSQTFARFYNRPLVEKDNYLTSVLNLLSSET
ncbi:unnamed protein product [Acanthoscelides obtectus]|uniref:Tyr recombinase domain-containing protein n=1 Tax=Acanthoscelides obtectus TaxID=200917 RepID=A0A9P0MHV0_ACAOB|nr:unnamed protein product [Acanthoscelides obtectus]CAK1675487.1 hypothetical protein AOBTE_LOCUS30252 [Acanthoscelides obtectus]